MNTLAIILHVLLYITAIIGLLVVIYTLIAGTINSINIKKEKEEFETLLDKALAEALEELLNEEKETNKAKKKATKKKEK